MKKSELRQLIRECIQEVYRGEKARYEEEYTMGFPLNNYSMVKKLFDTLKKRKLIYSVYVPSKQEIVDDPEQFQSRGEFARTDTQLSTELRNATWFDVSFSTDYYHDEFWGPENIGDWCKKHNIETL